MPVIRDDEDERLARLEQMLEALRHEQDDFASLSGRIRAEAASAREALEISRRLLRAQRLRSELLRSERLGNERLTKQSTHSTHPKARTPRRKKPE